MPRARATALSALAAAAAADPRLFSAEQDLDRAIARLRALPGVGEWTAQYIALRALHEPDAFPAGDIGILRALANGDERPTTAAALGRAEAWRPWRAYAAQHLWTAGAVKHVPRSRARQEAVA
jgi:AraC family transcriptional regulator of adaptative response / DNA-3-methyladenine glycosylase II